MSVRKIRGILGRPFRGSGVGMSIIEVIIVVALLGTLMTYLITKLTNTADQARVDQAQLGFGVIQQSLQLYRIHMGKYPTTEQGLNALTTSPGDTRWRGPYIEPDKLKDPWQQPFGYESDGTKFKIISGGIDNTLGSPDDLTYPAEDKPAG